MGRIGNFDNLIFLHLLFLATIWLQETEAGARHEAPKGHGSTDVHPILFYFHKIPVY